MLLFHCLQGFVTKQVNGNKYYIATSCIPCNTYSYSYVITITIYQTYPKFLCVYLVSSAWRLIYSIDIVVGGNY